MKQLSNFKKNRSALLRTSVVSGFLMLAVCASAQAAKEHDANGPNDAKSTDVTVKSPGYVALKKGDYMKAREYIKAADAKKPNDAFNELNLGAAYQETGRMDLAEPLYRQAMTHGHGLKTADTTTELSRGHTVEEIACQNLTMGLPPATVAGTATPCQTTIVMAIADPVAPSYATEPVVFDTPVHAHTAFNTYFEFNKATLTPEGREIVHDAAKQLLSDPKLQVNLVGKAGKIGTSSYNWELSRKRAETVRKELIAQGVPSSSINTTWTGETQLAVPQAEHVREPRNRVVEGGISK